MIVDIKLQDIFTYLHDMHLLIPLSL